MAVPVIGVTSVTKVPFSVYRHIGGSVGLTASYVTLPDVTIPSVVDGQKVFLNFKSYHNATHNGGAVRLIGATSNTVIHEYDNTAITPISMGENMGIWDLTKTTGVTEDILVQTKHAGAGAFHADGLIHSGKSTGQLQIVSVGQDVVSVKSTMQIDEIDMVCIGGSSSHGVTGCPTIGFSGTPKDIQIRTFTPNIMVNSLDFTNSQPETDQYRYAFVLYTFTGKKLVMS